MQNIVLCKLVIWCEKRLSVCGSNIDLPNIGRWMCWPTLAPICIAKSNQLLLCTSMNELACILWQLECEAYTKVSLYYRCFKFVFLSQPFDNCSICNYYNTKNQMRFRTIPSFNLSLKYLRTMFLTPTQKEGQGGVISLT